MKIENSKLKTMNSKLTRLGSLRQITGLLAIMLVGCAPQVRRPIHEGPTCPGKPTVAAAVEALALQRNSQQPFQASADGVILWRDEKGKDRDEPIRGGNLAFVPPDKVFFKGSIVFKEARFGTNQQEFWLRIKYELDTYWWGTRTAAQDCIGSLIFDPAQIAEAIGIVDVTPQWKLSYRDGYDILTLYRGRVIGKRIYVDACDYRVSLIEYFDAEGLKQVTIELSEYAAQDSGINVPTRIRAASYDPQGLKQSAVSFTLNNIRPLPPERQKPALFQRPAADGYGTVLRLNDDCQFVQENP
ncbi:MAG: hypothetical protein LLF76_14615 [Planctomycetaceae bacterium]|nr:hypothetical protein [Planctomycetaceae bacterium]